MSDVEPIIQNVIQVNLAAKDEIAKKVAQAVQMKRINLEAQELTLLLQVINAAIDSSYGNAENIIKEIAQRQIDASYDEGVTSGLKKSR